MSFDKCNHLSKTSSQASRMPALGYCIRRSSVRILFWNATRPVNLKERDDISRKISPFRNIVIEALAVSDEASMSLHSSRKVPMQDVTICSASMSAEHRDTSSRVSNLVK